MTPEHNPPRMTTRHELAAGSRYEVLPLTFGRGRIVVNNGMTYDHSHW